MENTSNRIMIRFDLDSVMNNLSEYWREMHKEYTGEDIQFDQWGVHELSEHGYDIYDYFEHEDFFLNAPVKEGARKTIQLVEKSPDVFGYTIISSCTQGSDSFEYINQQKLQWCKEELGDTAVMNFLLVGEDKSEFKGDVIVDDKPDNLIDQKPTGICLKILFNAPYNKNVTLEELEERDTDSDSHFMRVNTHEQLQKILKDILRAQSIENYLENV